METISKVSSEAPSLISSKRGPLAELYRNVLMEFKETKNTRQFANLWASLSPSGNIYRYLALSAERDKHCWDIRMQMVEIAEKYKGLLGEKKSQQQRVDTAITALKDAVAAGGIDSETCEEPLKGFMPLEEFCSGSVVRKCCWIFYPQDPSEKSRWLMNHFLAFIVFLIQTVGVFCLLVQLWFDENNPLQDPGDVWKKFTPAGLMCTGGTNTAALTTISGTLFLMLVYTIVYTYAQDELDNAEKSGRLPLNNFWTILSTVANALSGLLIVVAIPLEYWTEQGTQGIMMNSFALLFVFTLDDLTGDAFGYLAVDDCQFQQEASWNYALLAYCPVDIQSLIDPNATAIDKLWKIKYDNEGSLLDVNGCKCATRISAMGAPPTETSKLVKKIDEEGADEDMVVEYSTERFGRVQQLPGWRLMLLKGIWTVTTWLILALWFVVPSVWLAVNKPCKDVAAA